MDVSTNARSVESWLTILGVDAVSADLRKIIQLHDAAQYIEPSAIPVDVDGLPADALADKVTEIATMLATEEHFSTARRRVREALAHRVLAIASESVEEIRAEILEPEFRAAVLKFTEMVPQLPETLDFVAAAHSDTDALAIYKEAVQAQDVILKCDKWISSLRNVPGYGINSEAALRVLAPRNRRELSTVLGEFGYHSKKLGELIPVLVVAVEDGIPFRLNLPGEARALADEVNSTPVEKAPLKFSQFKKRYQ